MKIFLENFLKNKSIVILLLLIFSIDSLAAVNYDPPPLVMLKNTSRQMIGELDKNLGRLRGNEVLVRGIVKRLLVPHVDQLGMAQSVVGRLFWQSAAPTLRQQFIDQFSTYVIRTYAAALASYDGEIIKFYPIRNYDSNQSRVQVNSAINRREGPAIQVQYRLVNKGNNWLIYDFSVDGVSLIQNYRAQFADTLRQGGLSLLVRKLIEKNSRVKT